MSIQRELILQKMVVIYIAGLKQTDSCQESFIRPTILTIYVFIPCTELAKVMIRWRRRPKMNRGLVWKHFNYKGTVILIWLHMLQK
jgi:hypothetical protein